MHPALEPKLQRLIKNINCPSKTIPWLKKLTDAEYLEIWTEFFARRWEQTAKEAEQRAECEPPHVAAQLRRLAFVIRKQAEFARHPTRAPSLAEQVRLGLMDAHLAASMAASFAKEDTLGNVTRLTGSRRRSVK